MEKQPLLNTYVNNMDMAETLDAIEDLVVQGKKSYIVPINVDVVMKMESDQYLNLITKNAEMVLVDGMPLVWIAKWHGRPVKEKISGSDIVPLLCDRASKKGYSVFILGGKEGVGDKAKERLEREFPQINVVGAYSPPLGFEKDEVELEKINSIISKVHPDFLIVCLGCPKQEKWIYENYLKCGATVSICAGATVDFLAGEVKRAPQWVSKLGFEWFYRFLKEPKRMFKRYFIDDVKILKLILKYR